MIRSAVDIGSNTVRLLIAEPEGGTLRLLLQRVEATRLAGGINEGRLRAENMARTVEVLRDYCALAAEYGAEPPLLVATSAVRDAANREEFQALVQREIGLSVRVLRGEEEAELSFRGAAALAADAARAVVFDIGGGSTELIFRAEDGLRAFSANVGAVRAREAGWDAARIESILRESFAQLPQSPFTLIGAGGTVTAAVAVRDALREYRREAVHGTRLSRAELESLRQRLLPLSPAERLAEMPQLLGRADVMEYGLLIARLLLDILGADSLLVSDSSLLDSLILYGLPDGSNPESRSL